MYGNINKIKDFLFFIFSDTPETRYMHAYFVPFENKLFNHLFRAKDAIRSANAIVNIEMDYFFRSKSVGASAHDNTSGEYGPSVSSKLLTEFVLPVFKYNIISNKIFYNTEFTVTT